MTIADSGRACMLTEHVLEWYQSKETLLLPMAIQNLKEMDAMFQKGSMLHDSVQVLLTLCHDFLVA